MRILPVVFVCLAIAALAAPPDRIHQPVDSRETRVVAGNLHKLAQPQFDRGPVDAGMSMNYIVVFLKPSANQQADIDQLLADQQNPSSPQFRKWLTPEQFGDRFGLSSADRSKVVAWLNSSGFKIEHLSRAQNWIAFSGTAGQVESALHAPIHRFQVNGEAHFANSAEPSVPAALADVVGGFLGLNDFRPESFAIPVSPDYDVGNSHFLAPADFATIYDLNPLYQAGIDGTGQSIAIAGASDIMITDISSFRARYGLPVNNPKLVPYGTVDPGFNGAALEADLDLEWSGAVAPKATIYYVYGPNIFASWIYAIEENIAPVLSISAGACEPYYSPIFYRALAQQANTQGITLLAASGDSGAAGCDPQGYQPFAERGRAVNIPASLPEVTAVGGTSFAEGSGNYWAPTNSSTFGSALSYIPEQAWNESSPGTGLGSGGGGPSVLFSQPGWQVGPGVPSDGVRHVPDISLSAAIHDGYFIDFLGTNGAVSGTSASSPSMAGIVALLNHYQIANGFQGTPGLGNINPQLYRLAQIAPSAFHDIISGNNIVPCAQATPDCLTGSFGYQTTPGYDMATGLGSVDANALATQWNMAAQGVVVKLSSNTTNGTVNDTIQATVTVTAASGSGTPTGTVSFVFIGLNLGSATLTNGAANISIPLSLLEGFGTATLHAEYSGDAQFSSGGASLLIRVSLPTGAAAVLVSAPNTVWPAPPDAAGLSWQTSIVLRELGGAVPALVTGFTIDGQAQSLSQYLPSPSIPQGGSIAMSIVFRNLAAPLTHVFGFTGVDADGNSWSRQASVLYQPLPPGAGSFNLAATPLVISQNTSANASCQWSTQLNIDDAAGYPGASLLELTAGAVNLTSQIPSIFGTPRLSLWNGLQGTLCFSGITPPASDTIYLLRNDGTTQQLTVSFTSPPSNSVTLSATPPSLGIAVPKNSSAQTTLEVNLSGSSEAWTASVYPNNITTSWLTVSPLSGTGSGKITLTANGAGFEPGAYRATVILQSPNAVPQFVDVPVMMVLGGSSSASIGGIVEYGSNIAAASPGTLLSVYGANLANSTVSASTLPLAFSLGGVSATVNDLAAPVFFVSPNNVIIQVPYEAGAGQAVLGINNNGAITGFQFQIAPSSPAILADAQGNVLPTGKLGRGAGAEAAIYVVGIGDVSPALLTGFSTPSGLPIADFPKPLLPLSVTVGGQPAFVRFAGITPGILGLAQVNISLDSSTPTGNQPVVVTVGGVPSPPANLLVQ